MAGVVVHAARDEPLDPTARVNDAEGRVLCADQRPDLVDDDLQDIIHGAEIGNPSDRGIKGSLDLVLRPYVGTRRLGHLPRAYQGGILPTLGPEVPRNRARRHWSERACLANDERMVATIAQQISAMPSPGLRRVLLATDLSSASERAADEAIRLAVESRAQLLVLSVVDPARLHLPGGRFLRRIDQERERIQVGVKNLADRANAAGANATFLVWEGDPAEVVLAASEAEDVDVVILGSHRRGLLGRLVLGSLSARVSELARCPVLVVPR